MEPGEELQERSTTFLAPETGFLEDDFTMDPGQGVGNGFRMIWAHYLHCALHYYYLSSTQHQALDPGGWEPLS